MVEFIACLGLCYCYSPIVWWMEWMQSRDYQFLDKSADQTNFAPIDRMNVNETSP